LTLLASLRLPLIKAAHHLACAEINQLIFFSFGYIIKFESFFFSHQKFHLEFCAFKRFNFLKLRFSISKFNCYLLKNLFPGLKRQRMLEDYNFAILLL